MKTLTNYVITCGLLATINAVDVEDPYLQFCPHELTMYGDASGSMCSYIKADAEHCGDEEFICVCNPGASDDPCSKSVAQATAIDSLVEAYVTRLTTLIDHPADDTPLTVTTYGNNVTTPPLYKGAIGDFHGISIESVLCLGYTVIENMYQNMLDNCGDYGPVQNFYIFSDFIWRLRPDRSDVAVAKLIKQQISKKCPRSRIYCWRIGNDPDALNDTALVPELCDGMFYSADYDTIVIDVDNYVTDLLAYLEQTCRNLDLTYKKISPPTPTYTKKPAVMPKLYDPPTAVTSDSDDGFWWWWILLAAIGALLCCLGGACAYKRKNAPGMEIEHANPNMRCDDDVEVQDAEIAVY